MDLRKIDWTHKNAIITDIRKISNLYILAIKDENITVPLLINEKIFNERLKIYFLKEPSKVSREEILGVKWNMYITKGHYIKMYGENDVKVFDMEENKFYVSYLEISGPLASFSSVCKETEKKELATKYQSEGL